MRNARMKAASDYAKAVNRRDDLREMLSRAQAKATEFEEKLAEQEKAVTTARASLDEASKPVLFE